MRVLVTMRAHQTDAAESFLDNSSGAGKHPSRSRTWHERAALDATVATLEVVLAVLAVSSLDREVGDETVLGSLHSRDALLTFAVAHLDHLLVRSVIVLFRTRRLQLVDRDQLPTWSTLRRTVDAAVGLWECRCHARLRDRWDGWDMWDGWDKRDRRDRRDMRDRWNR